MAYSLVRGFGSDLHVAARRLAATPLFTMFAILSLAIGVGVTTATYSVVDSVFLKDLGVPDPDRLVFIVTPYDGRFLKGSVSPPDFDDLRAAQRSFSRLSASVPFEAAVVLPSTTEMLAGEAVDGAYFATLAVGVRLGRPVQPPDAAAAIRVVVISDALWRPGSRSLPYATRWERRAGAWSVSKVPKACCWPWAALRRPDWCSRCCAC